MKRIKVLVSGNVQGVSFRSFIKRKAVLLKLKGFVRNTPDGRVEALFEGSEEEIKKIIEICRTGPETASVKSIEVIEEDYKAEFNSFSIL